GGPGDVAGGVLDLAGDLLAGRRVDALVDRLTRRALGGGDRPVALQRRPGRLADSDGEVVRGPAEVDARHRIAGDLRRAVAAADQGDRRDGERDEGQEEQQAHPDDREAPAPTLRRLALGGRLVA